MAKKSFITSNPALSFISRETVDKVDGREASSSTGKAPEGYKPNPEYVEVKSRRVQLLLQPSIVDALKALAKEKGMSMNETANEAIKAYIEREQG